MTSSLNPFRSLQRHRNYRLFWMGQTVSLIGTWMHTVAVGWTALELTNNVFLVGLVSAADSLPVLLFSLYAGVMADRVDRRRTLLVLQSLLLLEAAALWWLAWTGAMTFSWLLVLTVLGGVVGSVEMPVRQAMISDLVPSDELLDAIALNSSGFNLARIVGPAIAAVVIAHMGIAGCFGVNALSYLAVLYSLSRIRLAPHAVSPSSSTPLKGVKEGLAYVRGTPQIAAVMWLIAFVAIFGIPYIPLLPVIARDVLGTDASGYGMLMTCVGIGALIGALGLASVGQRFRRGRLLHAAAIAFPCALMAFSLARNIVIAGILLGFVGFCMIFVSALSNATLQTLAPDTMRGRVMSTFVFFYVGLSPFGSLLAGAVARGAGAPLAIGGGAAILLAFALWTFHRVPALRA